MNRDRIYKLLKMLQGKYINEYREFEDWWETESSDRYQENAMCLMNQYQMYRDPVLGLNVSQKMYIYFKTSIYLITHLLF